AASFPRIRSGRSRGNQGAGPRRLFGGDDLAAPVVPAVGAYPVGLPEFAAVGALHQLRRPQPVVGPSHVAARPGHLALGYGHDQRILSLRVFALAQELRQGSEPGIDGGLVAAAVALIEVGTANGA